jgi:hypothetical protein
MQVQVEQRRVIQIIRAEVMSDRPEFRAYSLGRHNLGDGIDPFIQLDHFYMRAPNLSAPSSCRIFCRHVHV